ncbi:MAG: hypothetical protein AAFV43_08265 [Planctomycetota bacterium]
MAARQDQNLQIALIVCGVLIFALGIGLYFAYSSYQKESATVADLTQQRSSSDQAAREATSQAVDLKTMLGFDGGVNFSDVKAQFEEDQTRYMGTFEESNRNYRAVIDTLAEENRKIAEQENQAKLGKQQALDTLAAMEAEHAAEIKQFKERLDATQADLARERQAFENGRTELEQQRASLSKSLDGLRQDFESRLADATKAQKQAERERTDAERSREQLLAQRATDDPSFEVADGRITFVNQATGAAWINLGEADSLRRQVTFSVFESELTDAGKADKKGSVEVVRILGEHLAEAKITSDDASNPVLPGDQIYSQVWQRGKKLRFALTGLIDLDGDGRSDLQQAKDLIALNGGEIDASLEADGTTDGEMTINTRYLVLGEPSNLPSMAKLREGYNTMSKRAEALGVETITVDDFVNQMGYRPSESTFRYGAGRKGSGGSAPGGSNYFRYRLP